LAQATWLVGDPACTTERATAAPPPLFGTRLLAKWPPISAIAELLFTDDKCQHPGKTKLRGQPY